jgi:TetR/AcrR family transcriptional regulator, transcriptional repressor of aconitase
MPKVSEAHLEARREQILDGARRAFARHGYHGATVARLEEEVGLSRGAIFNYYPDKWSLFLALVRRDRHRFSEVLRKDGLDGLLRQMTEESPEWLGVYFELAHRLRTNPELMDDLKDAAPEEAEQSLALFEAWQREGAVRGDVSLETIIHFMNVVSNGIALGTSLGLKFDVEQFLKLVHTGIDPLLRAGRIGEPDASLNRRRKRAPQ